MQIQVMKSKIHRVKVTQADLNYIGSITIDENLMVQVVNINNGERLETYVIKGDRGTGTICLNGPAARKVAVGDIVLVISYALMEVGAAKSFTPTVIFPDENTNQLKS